MLIVWGLVALWSQFIQMQKTNLCNPSCQMHVFGLVSMTSVVKAIGNGLTARNLSGLRNGDVGRQTTVVAKIVRT